MENKAIIKNEDRSRGPELYHTKGGERAMSTYIILSTLTEEGWRHIKQKPGRIMEVNKEMESLGVKVQKQYALLGEYDFLNIIEAADNETVMKMSVELGSRGSVKVTTLPAVTMEEFIGKIAIPKAA
jgi:uncharacterized protein with GYD domain